MPRRSCRRTLGTVAETIRAVARRFRRAKLYFGHGTETAQDEAAWLVGHALKLAPDKLAGRLNQPVTPATLKKIDALATVRIQTRRPLAYLLKEAWFAGRKFYVDERVIVPRSLTGEFITEQFQPWIDAKRVQRILDLCTGSGCMAIACAQAFPRARVDAADISAEALAVARLNVKRHRLGRRVQLVRSDLFRALKGRNYDVIVTNPPYVAHTEMKTLPREYLHEPELALVSGRQGLDAIVRILADAPRHLNPGGILVGEVGNSAETLQRKFPSVPFVWLTTSTGDESVFLLTAEELIRQRRAFRTAG
ncbi:N5-glutamine S-adenosyl-L-methionine-dependent methyltransferase [Sulfuricaulis limicola]|uniref:N5-glutamine S-adenosyl-L-methionine-dependent methyltransferase n=1 Tax=Sulfuricaulis limicola TaxID=1620215 RepID=A0A1B4XJP6_9GAMM|nr:50S ribosomal protein L3 N(5)-glutamine methyltransferase [Sulfuricaulis limicola]BAV35030.1 N5-glutamine S-adenosyl-L-methionine-dependent methyltransferase [Sulfuricaulis limicola]